MLALTHHMCFLRASPVWAHPLGGTLDKCWVVLPTQPQSLPTATHCGPTGVFARYMLLID